MPDANDMDLVREFARDNSEAAFTELVRRHLNLVYSVARRCTGNDGDAHDVTQAVFIILARKAAGLREKTLLTGWLYETTRFAAARLLRTNARRHAREQEAYMQSTLNEADTAAVWEKLSPHLEAAMSKLAERDRALLVLRFYENKSGPEAAALLGIREDAAHKRVARAIEKLRKVFAQRGVTLSCAAIAGAVSANSVQAAPVALVKTISAIAVAKGAAATTSILTLVKGALKLMAWSKAKTAIAVGVGILLAGGVATLAISHHNDNLPAQEIAMRAQNLYAAFSSYSDSGKVVTEGAGQTTETTFNIRMQRPNLYRIDWTQTGGLYVGKGVVWSDGNGDNLLEDSADKITTAKAQKMHDMQYALGGAGGASSSAASMIPGIFFSKNGGSDALFIAAAGRTKLTKLPDEKIGDVDCNVISSVIDPETLPGGGKLTNDIGTIGTTTTEFWIGEKDHLIHQTQTTLEASSISMKFTDENLKTILERQNKPATPEALAALRAEMDRSMVLAQSGKFVFTQTHENIVVNQRFSPTDFTR